MSIVCLRILSHDTYTDSGNKKMTCLYCRIWVTDYFYLRLLLFQEEQNMEKLKKHTIRGKRCDKIFYTLKSILFFLSIFQVCIVNSWLSEAELPGLWINSGCGWSVKKKRLSSHTKLLVWKKIFVVLSSNQCCPLLKPNCMGPLYLKWD